MRTIIYISLLLLSFGCDLAPSGDEYQEAPAYISKPTNANEHAFEKDLRQRGFTDVRFRVPSNLVSHRVNGQYEVKLELDKQIQADSVKKLRFELVNKLYKEVIADSLMLDLRYIDFSICLPETQKNRSKKRVCYYQRYHIESLAEWNSFKVVSKTKGVYERVPFP